MITARNVLITGASSGIGWATAKYLAGKGYQVFGTTRSLQKRQKQLAEVHAAFGGRLQFLEMDVTQDASVTAAVKQVLQQASSIDVLICNAGYGIYGSIEEMPIEQVYKQFETNFFGCLRTLQPVIPHMRERKNGRIILTSSIAGSVTVPFYSHYSATIFAIEALTEGLRQELRPFDIQVSAVRPGVIRTEFNDVTYKHIPANSPYKPWLEKLWQTVDKNMQIAPQPLLVAKVIYKILQKRHPRAFYTAADFFTSLSSTIMPMMTSKLKEKVVRMFYGI